jgi:hypothetical protein
MKLTVQVEDSDAFVPDCDALAFVQSDFTFRCGFDELTHDEFSVGLSIVFFLYLILASTCLVGQGVLLHVQT